MLAALSCYILALSVKRVIILAKVYMFAIFILIL